MNVLTKLLIRLLAVTITPKAARQINELLIYLLEQVARRTANRIDDQLVAHLRRLIRQQREK